MTEVADNGGAAGAGAGAAGEGGASAMDFLGGSGGAGDNGGAGGGTGAEGQGGAQDQQVQGGADPDWYSQLSGETGEGETASLRDFVKANDVKDLNGLAKIARDNQKALRESGRIKVPGEGAGEAEISAYRKAIGVPDSADGYAMPVLTGDDGQPVKMDTAKLANIASIAHANGIPKAAFEATMQAIAEADAGDFAAAELQLSREADAHVKSWGGDKDNKLAAVNAAIGALGLKRNEVLQLRAALGPARSLDLMAQIGAGVSEDTLINGDREGGGFLGDPVAAQREMDQMKLDPKVRDKVFIAGTPEHSRWNRLQDIVGQAEERKRLQMAG